MICCVADHYLPYIVRSTYRGEAECDIIAILVAQQQALPTRSSNSSTSQHNKCKLSLACRVVTSRFDSVVCWLSFFSSLRPLASTPTTALLHRSPRVPLRVTISKQCFDFRLRALFALGTRCRFREIDYGIKPHRSSQGSPGPACMIAACQLETCHSCVGGVNLTR